MSFPLACFSLQEIIFFISEISPHTEIPLPLLVASPGLTIQILDFFFLSMDSFYYYLKYFKKL